MVKGDSDSGQQSIWIPQFIRTLTECAFAIMKSQNLWTYSQEKLTNKN